jgi:DNA (cytosine-5)-methyltransferase 1
MTRPRLLDLFCCQGGAGKGYTDAGFDVTGVDIEPQPRYPYDFHQADALEYLAERWRDFDVVHASPPCQRYANVTQWRGSAGDHPDLLDPTRQLLNRIGLPYVLENVPEAPIRADYLLCGSQFGLSIRRHRAFETSWRGFSLIQPCQHRGDDLPFMHKGERAYADALGCPWMSSKGGREAIPPAYTRYVGEQLLEHLRQAAA